jgi:hypothetical protein
MKNFATLLIAALVCVALWNIEFSIRGQGWRSANWITDSKAAVPISLILFVVWTVSLPGRFAPDGDRIRRALPLAAAGFGFGLLLLLLPYLVMSEENRGRSVTQLTLFLNQHTLGGYPPDPRLDRAMFLLWPTGFLALPALFYLWAYLLGFNPKARRLLLSYVCLSAVIPVVTVICVLIRRAGITQVPDLYLAVRTGLIVPAIYVALAPLFIPRSRVAVGDAIAPAVALPCQ